MSKISADPNAARPVWNKDEHDRIMRTVNFIMKPLGIALLDIQKKGDTAGVAAHDFDHALNIAMFIQLINGYKQMGYTLDDVRLQLETLWPQVSKMAHG